MSTTKCTTASARRQIARETAAKINAINQERDRQVREVYEEFKRKQQLLAENGSAVGTYAASLISRETIHYE